MSIRETRRNQEKEPKAMTGPRHYSYLRSTHYYLCQRQPIPMIRYDKLHDYISNFINKTGLAMLETDGPYGGGSCASTNHSHHHGLEDSVYRQTQLQSTFYHEMRRLNV